MKKLTLSFGIVETFYTLLMGLAMGTVAISMGSKQLDLSLFSNPDFLRVALPLMAVIFGLLAFTPIARLTPHNVIALNSYGIPRKLRWEEVGHAKLISVFGIHNLLVYKDKKSSPLWVPMPMLSRTKIRAFMEENIDSPVVTDALKLL